MADGRITISTIVIKSVKADKGYINDNGSKELRIVFRNYQRRMGYG